MARLRIELPICATVGGVVDAAIAAGAAVGIQRCEYQAAGRRRPGNLHATAYTIFEFRTGTGIGECRAAIVGDCHGAALLEVAVASGCERGEIVGGHHTVIPFGDHHVTRIVGVKLHVQCATESLTPTMRVTWWSPKGITVWW